MTDHELPDCSYSFMVCFSTLFIVSLSLPANFKVIFPDSAFLLLRPRIWWLIAVVWRLFRLALCTFFPTITRKR